MSSYALPLLLLSSKYWAWARCKDGRSSDGRLINEFYPVKLLEGSTILIEPVLLRPICMLPLECICWLEIYFYRFFWILNLLSEPGLLWKLGDFMTSPAESPRLLSEGESKNDDYLNRKSAFPRLNSLLLKSSSFEISNGTVKFFLTTYWDEIPARLFLMKVRACGLNSILRFLVATFDTSDSQLLQKPSFSKSMCDTLSTSAIWLSSYFT